MPWSHCDVAFILDDEDCPSCGANKAAWTVQVDKTRNLVISLPRGWLELQLVDRHGAPLVGHAVEVKLANGTRKRGELDEDGVIKLTSLSPGPLDVQFAGVDLRHTRRHLHGEQAGTRTPGERPIEVTKEQCRKTEGARHVFVLAPPLLKLDLPLEVRFGSQAEATTWMLRNPVTVTVDGAPVAHGAFVGDRERVVVQFAVPVGEHEVVVSSASARGQIVYLRQTVRAATGTERRVPAQTAGPVAPRRFRAPRARASETSAPVVAKVAAPVVPRAQAAPPVQAKPPVQAMPPVQAKPAAAPASDGPKPPTLKVDLPLKVKFATQTEAAVWLLKEPIAVEVDGAPVAHGAFAASAEQVVVQLSLTEGGHDVTVSSNGPRGRVVLLRQKVRATRGGAPARAPAPARAAPEPRRWRAPRGRGGESRA